MITLVLTALAIIRPPVFDPPCHEGEVRLATYNTAFLPYPASTEDRFQMDAPQRAALIAQNILTSGPEIIALEEVFDDRAKHIFERDLSAEYPYFVSYLDDGAFLDPESDSGLMLFSKLPFVPFTVTPPDYMMSDGWAIANHSFWSQVGFRVFRTSAGNDRLANKGVGLVRIDVPCAERTLDVAFTHMQASEDETPASEVEKQEIRRAQLAVVRDLIEHLVTPAEMTRQEIYLLGDLNIDGHDSAEWRARFDPATAGGDRFFKDTLRDTRFDTSRFDLLETEGTGFPEFVGSPQSGHRFDYFLRSQPANATLVCAQHQTIGYELGEWGGTQYSDHLAMELSTQRWSPNCTPREARQLVPRPHDQAPGQISFEESVQWFRVDDAGAFSINVVPNQGQQLAFDVYEMNDLTRPIRSNHGDESDYGVVFSMPQAPFFIRVRGVRPSDTGSFSVIVHRSTGHDRLDAIPLAPAESELYVMPSLPLNPENAVWFSFHTANTTADVRPRLLVRTFSFEQAPFSFRILDEQGNEVATPNGFELVSGQMIRSAHTSLAPGRYFVVVTPQFTTPANIPFEVEFQTSFTRVSNVTLRCDTQDDDFGKDDISLFATADGRDWLGGWRYLGEWVNQSRTLDLGLPVRDFNDSLSFHLVELDGGLGSDDDFGTRSATLPMSQPSDEDSWAIWQGPAYHYTMRMKLVHDTQDRKRPAPDR